ncbi:MAG TPA: hypothetical protein VGO61_06975 [Steroidobacteraceae bacterium]|jgi:hypothetical protein|nr:hypothetical protein [Steroidobacteraceae bacterium]
MHTNDEDAARNAMLDFADAPAGFGLPASFRQLSPVQAKLTLDKLLANPEFGKGAVTRGTPHSAARVWLTAKQNGVDMPNDELARVASGQAGSEDSDTIE